VPTKIEKDSLTGKETTGHEWDGLKELNSPLPKWWLYVFYTCIAWALGLCVLYPSIPLGGSYVKGMLGYSSRRAVDADVAAIAGQRKVSMDKIAALDYATIKASPDLYEVAMVGGAAAFATNCQPCHGGGGAGRPGYPALAAGAWIWGGSLDAIQQTVTHGMNESPLVLCPKCGKPMHKVPQATNIVWGGLPPHLEHKRPRGAQLILENQDANRESYEKNLEIVRSKKERDHELPG
jgi:cbb3-type cytochrome c oxidase subunit III